MNDILQGENIVDFARKYKDLGFSILARVLMCELLYKIEWN